MKILICGSREDFDLDIAKQRLEEFIKKHMEDSFIHGGARGIDSMADNILKSMSLPVKVYLSDYQSYGIKAPLVRDRQMVTDCDMVVAFWNFKSHGTKFTIDYAKGRLIPVEIFDIRSFKGPSRRIGT